MLSAIAVPIALASATASAHHLPDPERGEPLLTASGHGASVRAKGVVPGCFRDPRDATGVKQICADRLPVVRGRRAPLRLHGGGTVRLRFEHAVENPGVALADREGGYLTAGLRVVGLDASGRSWKVALPHRIPRRTRRLTVGAAFAEDDYRGAWAIAAKRAQRPPLRPPRS